MRQLMLHIKITGVQIFLWWSEIPFLVKTPYKNRFLQFWDIFLIKLQGTLNVLIT